MYSYSKDHGSTWSDEVGALAGGDEWDGYYGDWRDSKVIRMSNGKFLLSQTKGYAKPNGNTPPYHVDYDSYKYKACSIIYSEKPDGMLDVDNPIIVQMPLPSDANYMFTAGGLVEHDRVVYHTVYGNSPNTCWLLKSADFGVTWQSVGKIADGYNENSIAFIGDVMYCLMRNVNGNARVVKSLDFGETWSILTDMDNYWHGMYLLGLGDSIMVCGRAYNGDTTIIFFDKNGNTLLNPIRYSTGGDSAYSQICTFENYVYIIYYRQLNAVSWSVCTRKVERNKVLGLSY